MKKFYHLGNCTTCQRISKELSLSTNFIHQDIKLEQITSDQLEEMAKLTGSYESLFSRRAMKYKELGLKDKTLTEADYKYYILKEYTFLKRPVLIVDKKIFVGNSKKNIENAVNEVQNK